MPLVVTPHFSRHRRTFAFNHNIFSSLLSITIRLCAGAFKSRQSAVARGSKPLAGVRGTLSGGQCIGAPQKLFFPVFRLSVVTPFKGDRNLSRQEFLERPAMLGQP